MKRKIRNIINFLFDVNQTKDEYFLGLKLSKVLKDSNVGIEKIKIKIIENYEYINQDEELLDLINQLGIELSEE